MIESAELKYTANNFLVHHPVSNLKTYSIKDLTLYVLLYKQKIINPIWSGLFEGCSAWGTANGGGAYNSKTINDNEVKIGGEVEGITCCHGNHMATSDTLDAKFGVT